MEGVEAELRDNFNLQKFQSLSLPPVLAVSKVLVGMICIFCIPTFLVEFLFLYFCIGFFHWYFFFLMNFFLVFGRKLRSRCLRSFFFGNYLMTSHNQYCNNFSD